MCTARRCGMRPAQVLEEFDPLRAQFRTEIGEPSNVSAWAGKTVNEAGADWIGNKCHDDGEIPGSGLSGSRRARAGRHNHIHLAFD